MERESEFSSGLQSLRLSVKRSLILMRLKMPKSQRRRAMMSPVMRKKQSRNQLMLKKKRNPICQQMYNKKTWQIWKLTRSVDVALLSELLISNNADVKLVNL